MMNASGQEALQEKQTERVPWRCLLILGMHRSGTSALGGVLNAFDVYMGDDLEEPKEENPRGFFEHKRIMALNEDILRRIGSSWDDPCPLPENWTKAQELDVLYTEAEDFLRTEFAGHPTFAIKDPRICVLFPFWASIFGRLGIEVNCVLSYRSLFEVGGSLRKRNGFSLEKTSCLWFKHLFAAEFHSREYPRCVIGFEQLLDSPGAVAAMLQRSFPSFFSRSLGDVEERLEGVLDKKLRHHTHSMHELPPGYPEYLSVAASLFENSALAGKVRCAEKLDDLRNRFERDSAFFLNRDTSEELHAARTLGNEIACARQRLADVENYVQKYSTLIRLSDKVQQLRHTCYELLPGKVRTFFSFWREYGLGWTARHTLKRILPNVCVDYYRFLKVRHGNTDMRKAVASAGRVVVCFPIIDWDFRWQRPQQLMTRFARRGDVVLYLSMLPRPITTLLGNSRQAAGFVDVTRLSDNVFGLRLPSLGPFNPYTDKLEENDLSNMQLGLEGILSLCGAKDPVYMVQFPGWAQLACRQKNVRPGRLVFDIMDEHSGFSSNAEDALADEENLTRRADLVIASSDRLYATAVNRNPKTILVRNGAEFEHFHRPRSNGRLEEYGDKPVIGYYGAISDWFDMDLLITCARKRPDWNFVLIGFTQGADISQAAALQNVHFLGEKPYAELPGYLADFDVCIIPFKIIPLTLATNPVKFYEFMCAGKPVVSVRLPELEHYASHCFLAADADEFVVLIEKALLADLPETVGQRVALGRENSWDSRAETIRDALGA